MFVSDNNGFDWQFVKLVPVALHRRQSIRALQHEPRLALQGPCPGHLQTFKHLRKTAHTHHPVDDALGNAEALLEMKKMGLKIAL